MHHGDIQNVTKGPNYARQQLLDEGLHKDGSET